MLCFVKDRKNDVGIYVNNYDLEIRDSENKIVKARYKLEELYKSINSMMKLLKISDDDLYNYSLVALNKLCNNIGEYIGVKNNLKVTNRIEIRDCEIFISGYKFVNNIEQLKRAVGAKELFICTLSQYRKYGFDSEDKIAVTSIEQDGVVIKIGDLVKRGNLILQIENIEVLMHNREYGIVKFRTFNKAVIENYSDLAKYKKNITKEEKESYIKRRSLLGFPV